MVDGMRTWNGMGDEWRMTKWNGESGVRTQGDDEKWNRGMTITNGVGIGDDPDGMKLENPGLAWMEVGVSGCQMADLGILGFWGKITKNPKK